MMAKDGLLIENDRLKILIWELFPLTVVLPEVGFAPLCK